MLNSGAPHDNNPMGSVIGLPKAGAAGRLIHHAVKGSNMRSRAWRKCISRYVR